jgi:hypothetical protein
LKGRLRLTSHQMQNSRSNRATAPKRIMNVGNWPRLRAPAMA